MSENENLVRLPPKLVAAARALAPREPEEAGPQAPTVNTPETLGATPHYVLQHNAISRSIQNLSATAKKLTAMAMALIPPDLSNLTAAFTFPEFCKALGMPVGGEQYKIFKDAVKECMQCVITIETEPNKKGKKDWRQFTWFIDAQYSETTGKATMVFSPVLAEVLLDIKRAYAKIDLQDMGKLQSKYALRYLELAKSYSFLQGKDGNQDDSWYFAYPLDELRLMLSVPDDSYPETRDLRKYVVENPLKELNHAGIGLEVTTESIKQGRNLTGIRFNCKKVAKTVSIKGKKKTGKKKTGVGSLELADPNPKTENFRHEKENQRLKELYPDEFAALYEAALAAEPPSLTKNNIIGKAAAESEALIQLRKRHGIVK